MSAKQLIDGVINIRTSMTRPILTLPHSVSQHLIDCLAGGLRATYQADAETEAVDAFADLIARMQVAEDASR